MASLQCRAFGVAHCHNRTEGLVCRAAGSLRRTAANPGATGAVHSSLLRCNGTTGLGPGTAAPCSGAFGSCRRPHLLQQSRRAAPLPAPQAMHMMHEPMFQYVAQRAWREVALPVVVALLLVQLLNKLAQQATKAYESADDSVLEVELLRMAPIALQGPTKSTLILLVGTRILRNSVAIFDGFIHNYYSKLDKTVDPIVHSVCGVLGPLDAALLKLYGAVMLGCITWVLIQWKSIAITYYVRHQRRHHVPTTDVERALLPLDSVISWLMAALCGLYVLHWYGFNLQPLLAVGGASSIIIGLATQQTLTNAVNGLFLFLTRPFVTGEFVTLQGGGVVLNGIVENVGIMRTIVRNEDETLVSVPNKVVSDMTIQNRTALLSKASAADRIHLQQPIKVKVKVPHGSVEKLNELRAKITNELQEMTCNPNSVVVNVNKFTDQGVELLVKVLVDDVDSPRSQSGVLRLYERAREYGGTMVTA